MENALRPTLESMDPRVSRLRSFSLLSLLEGEGAPARSFQKREGPDGGEAVAAVASEGE